MGSYMSLSGIDTPAGYLSLYPLSSRFWGDALFSSIGLKNAIVHGNDIRSIK